MAPRLIPKIVGACFYADLRINNGPCSADGRAAFKRWCEVYDKPGGLAPEPYHTRTRGDLRELGEDAFAEHWGYLVGEWQVDPAGTRRALDAAYRAVVDAGLMQLDKLDEPKVIH